MPIVSVIIPCYSKGRFIGTALSSVAQQVFDDWELIAVDDAGPNDGTRAVVERFAREFPSKRVVYLHHEVNRGVSAARNTAIRESVGPYLALLDPDDFWLPNHLAAAVAALEQAPSVAVWSSPAHIFRDDPAKPELTIEFYEEWEREIFPCCLGLRNALPTSASVIRRTAFDAAGPFDESDQLQHIEDYDLWLRMAGLDLQFILHGEPTACYRKHAMGMTSDPQKMLRLQQALAVKHMPYLASLQKVALESLTRRTLELAHKIDLHTIELQRKERAIQSLEQANQNLRNSAPIKAFLSLRRLFRSGGTGLTGET
jgi:glycosyltransferase involved in cell wall biosynthesis